MTIAAWPDVSTRSRSKSCATRSKSIADEMGAVLKRTSFSPNIKERMDASCAIFDAEAQLVAQAEHVPVHLGSMLRAVAPTVDAVGS